MKSSTRRGLAIACGRAVLTAAQTPRDMGVAADRVAVRGYGETFPIAANDTAGNRQLNRRVEIVVSNGVGRIPRRQGRLPRIQPTARS